MTLQEALEILKAHQKWRRGEPPYEIGGSMPVGPTRLGQAIDVIIKALDQTDQKR